MNILDYFSQNKDFKQLKEITRKALIFRILLEQYYQLYRTGGAFHVLFDDYNYQYLLNTFEKTAKKENDIFALFMIELGMDFDSEDLKIINEEEWDIENHFEKKY